VSSIGDVGEKCALSNTESEVAESKVAASVESSERVYLVKFATCFSYETFKTI
jgi:hypothetical protein